MGQSTSLFPAWEDKPIQLHVMHSWGGGLERWVQDYCRTDTARTNIILKSEGMPGIPGQKLALYQQIDDREPIRSWELSYPIYATSITHLEYCHVIEEIINDFHLDSMVVSSLIGHSLDILNTNLKTIFICHDYYPFCPAINIYFDKVCTECKTDKLQQCFQKNPYNRFFTEVSASSWLPIRRIFVQLILQNEIILITPSSSIKNYLIQLEPRLKFAQFINIPHGSELASLDKPHLQIVNDKKSKLKVLILGSLAFQKGLNLLKDAYQEILDVAEIFLLGCGDEGSYFVGIQGIHLVAKSYSLAELPHRINAIAPDLGLLLSVWPETFSYTLSELMILGVPTLATKVGSFKDRLEEGKTVF